MSSIYEQLGVRTIINCATTYTRLGGSIMPPEVAQSLADAADAFVYIPELQDAVGRRLAELTHNEAAYVSNGAAAGLALATAACMTGNDPALMARLPNDTDGMRNEVVIHREHRNWYDVAIRQVGVRLIEIGHPLETLPWELDAAINERTAAVFYFYGSHFNRNALPLEYVIERAHERGVPVIVDGAAQVPPVENFWRFTRDMGADIAIFSGGKMIRGPQNSGLVVGRKEIIDGMQLNGPPVQRIGRTMKVSKEAMIGLLAAVERVLETDFVAKTLEWREVVDRWIAIWLSEAPDWIEIFRLDTNEAGEPIARVIVKVDPGAPIDRDDLVALLREGEHPIEVVVDLQGCVAFSPHLLREGDAEIVANRFREILQGLPATQVPEYVAST